MALLVPDEGEIDALEYYTNRASPQNLVLKLFTSNTVPAETDTPTSYTEATFTGYAALTLTGATWTAPSGDPKTTTYPEQTFTSTADQAEQLIYGYFMTRVTSGKLALVERFDAGPYSIKYNGDKLRLTPTISGA